MARRWKFNKSTHVDLHCGRCREVVAVLFMPTASAKYLSPLDNLLWQSFKKTVRKQHPFQANDIPESLSNTFFTLSTKDIRNAYRKCAIAAKERCSPRSTFYVNENFCDSNQEGKSLGTTNFDIFFFQQSSTYQNRIFNLCS